MTRTAKVLRNVAFTLMALFGLIGGMFVAGAAFFDSGPIMTDRSSPPVWQAVAVTAAWALPLIALCVFALRRPAAAGPVLVGATALVVILTLTDSAVGTDVNRDSAVYVAFVVFAIGVALAFLGLHRAELAGLLMVVAGLAQLAASRGHLDLVPGLVALPILVIGLLFLLAGMLGHESLRSGSGHAGRGQSTPLPHAS